jgi:hypothetical protein
VYMTPVLIVVVVCVLLSSGALFQWNAAGYIFEAFRDRRYRKKWDREFQPQIDAYNLYGDEAVDQLGEVGNTTQMAADQYARARSLSGQLSGQAKQDVMNNAELEAAGMSAMLRSRGITGSTIESPVLGGVNARRDAELRRVNDERIQTLLGVESAFGGAEIAANQAAADARLRNREGRYLVAPPVPAPFVPSGRR